MTKSGENISLTGIFSANTFYFREKWFHLHEVESMHLASKPLRTHMLNYISSESKLNKR